MPKVFIGQKKQKKTKKAKKCRICGKPRPKNTGLCNKCFLEKFPGGYIKTPAILKTRWKEVRKRLRQIKIERAAKNRKIIPTKGRKMAEFCNKCGGPIGKKRWRLSVGYTADDNNLRAWIFCSKECGRLFYIHRGMPGLNK